MTKLGPLTAFLPSDVEGTVPLPAGGIVFVARAVGAVARVQFKVNGRHAATEVVYSYALCTLKADGTALAGWKGAWHRRAFYLEAVVTGTRAKCTGLRIKLNGAHGVDGWSVCAHLE